MNPFTIFDIILAVPIFSLVAILYYSIATSIDNSYEYILFSVLTIFYIFLWNLIVVKKYIKKYEKIPLTKNQIRFIYSIMIVAIATMIAYIVLAGFPLLSSSPESDKLKVSQYPILVRFYRTIGLIPLIVAILVKDDRIHTTIIHYSITMILLGFLTAFKGYPVPFILALIALIFIEKKISVKFLLTILLIAAATIIFIMLASNVDFWNIGDFIIGRILTMQLLGTSELLSNYQSINYTPIVSEILLIPSKIFSENAMSLQQELYQLYHIYDYNKLELANFYLAEIYVYFGYKGIVSFLLISFLVLVLIRIWRYSVIAFACLVSFNISVIDGLINGKLIFRMVDFILFLMFSMLIVYVVSKFKFIKIKFEKI